MTSKLALTAKPTVPALVARPSARAGSVLGAAVMSAAAVMGCSTTNPPMVIPTVPDTESADAGADAFIAPMPPPMDAGADACCAPMPRVDAAPGHDSGVIAPMPPPTPPPMPAPMPAPEDAGPIPPMPPPVPPMPAP
jgi:hypothetical protein